MFVVEELAAAYLQGVADLKQAVAGLTPDQLHARPVAGKWSMMELVAHLADFEVVFADRIVRLIALDKPLLISADENQYTKNLAYVDRDIDEELAVVTAVRTKVTRMIRGLTPEQLGRAGVHSENGKVTVTDVVRYATAHFTHHLKFAAEKRAALGV